MLLDNLFKISQNDREQFSKELSALGRPNAGYYFMLLLAGMIVAVGLLDDNVLLSVAGILAFPALSSVLAFSFGIASSNQALMKRSLRSVLTSFLLIFLSSFLIGYFSYAQIEQSNLIWKLELNVLTALSAVFAGIALSYAWVKPGVKSALPSLVITVLLLPPLSTIALALANSEQLIFRNVLTLFLFNLAAILISSFLVFLLTGFKQAKRQRTWEREKPLNV